MADTCHMTKKRPIDANALKRAIRMESWKLETQIQLALDYIDIIIDEQPTVDAVEVVHGRWNKRDWRGISVPGFMACSACNVMIPRPDGNRYCLYKLRYCPNCGADMRDGDGNV